MTSLAPESLAATLVSEGVLIRTSVDGVYGQGAVFATIADGVSQAIRRHTAMGAERMRFASVMARSDLERIGYFRNFPHLLGTIHCFCGDEAQHRESVRLHDTGEAWDDRLKATDLVLIPAACYPVYAALARRGSMPAAGYTVQVEANCFRREPSTDPVRLQSFHMQEIVRVGRADDVAAFRDSWLTSGAALLSSWGLGGAVEPADDPFFGRAAVVMAKAQRAQELKFEWKTVVSDRAKPTACMSGNYHLDSFGRALGMTMPDGSPAHSACVGFGIERITLALLGQHGPHPVDWPPLVRQSLCLAPCGDGEVAEAGQLAST